MNVICFVNMKGGVGKTTLSINIANCLATRHSSKVLLIDIDPQFNSTQCLMSSDEYMNHLENEHDTVINIYDRKSRYITSSVIGSGEEIPKKMNKIKPVEIMNNFFLLPGDLNLYRIEMTPGLGRENILKRYIDEINEIYNFDYVIIDTPPTPSIWMTSALLASNFYLIPVKPDPISITGIDLLEAIIREKKYNYDLDIKCCGLVFTMVESNTNIYKKAVKFIENSSRWEKFKFKKELPKRTKIANTQMDKKFILDLDDNDAKLSITGITSELIKRIN